MTNRRAASSQATAVPRQQFQRSLQELAESTLALGRAVDRQLEGAARALGEGDTALAEAVRLGDLRINQAYAELQERGSSLLAQQGPMAGDLRLILAALAIATELERIADHAADVAEMVERTLAPSSLGIPAAMTQMAARGRDMVRDAMAAFERRDVATARALAPDDDEVDALQEESYRALIERARSDGSELEHSVYLAIAAHHLERVADRATNIAEQAVYLVTGLLDELNPSLPAGGEASAEAKSD
jgi:phosphate transport system protein